MSFISNYIMNYIALLRKKQPVKPLLFSYYITHRCMFSCSYCSDGNGQPFSQDMVKELSTSEAKELLTIISDDCDTLDITGGEPLIREDLGEIMAFAKEKKQRVVLNTKGQGIKEREDVFKYVDVLVLSIDSMQPSRLAAIIKQPEAVAETLLETLTYAVEKCRSLNKKLVVSTVALPENLDQIKEIVEFAEQHKILFHISPHIIGKHVNPDLEDNHAYQELLEWLILKKRVGSNILGVNQYLTGIRGFSSFSCYPLLMPVIRPDGHLVYPCLELQQVEIDLLHEKSYVNALQKAMTQCAIAPDCGNCCHIFCHMALSLLQQHPVAALKENKYW